MLTVVMYLISAALQKHVDVCISYFMQVKYDHRGTKNLILPILTPLPTVPAPFLTFHLSLTDFSLFPHSLTTLYPHHSHIPRVVPCTISPSFLHSLTIMHSSLTIPSFFYHSLTGPIYSLIPSSFPDSLAPNHSSNWLFNSTVFNATHQIMKSSQYSTCMRHQTNFQCIDDLY